VKIACWAQLVNHLSLVSCAKGGPLWKQTVYYPFAHAARYGRGIALAPSIAGPRYDTADGSEVPILDAAAVISNSGRELALFTVNRHLQRPLPVEVVLHGFGAYRPVEHIVYESRDPQAGNTREQPERVVPTARSGAALAASVAVEGKTATIALPAASWNVIRLEAVET